MAVVHLARQPELDRLVALKELSALRADDPSYAHRFLRESRLAGSLAHPNIVTVFDYFEHEGTPYIAMEYVDGGSLRSYLGQLSLAQIGGVLEGLTAGLMYAEECEIVHRDLKPENVMVTRHGRVKIADFGIAKATNTLYTTKWLTETGMTVGTPGYMAPEQAMGLTVGPGTDLYSLGCMAYEIFVGQVPFADSGTPMALLIRHINETVPPAHSVDPDVPAEVSAWIERLLIKEPDDRMPSAADAWDEFEDILFTLVGPRWRRESRLVAARDGGRFAQPRPATEPPEDGERRSSSASWQTFRGPGGEPVPGPYTPPPEDVLSQPSLVPPAERVPGPYTPPPADAVDDPSPATSDYETFVAPPPDRPPVDDFSAVEEDATPVAAEPAPVEPELPPTEAVPTPPAAATAPPAAATAPPAAATAPSAATVRPSRPAVRRRRAAVGVVIALIAAAAAVVVLTSSGDDPKPGPAAAKLAKLSAGPAALDAPAGWRPVASARQLGRGFTLKPASLAAQGGDPSKGVLAVGLAPRSAHNPTLVAPELIRSLGLRRGVTPDSEIVRLSGSGREALRYSGLRPPGRDQVATVYAVPTSGGVVTVECVSPLPAPASMEADCSRAASSLRLSGTAYPPRPSRAFAEQVNAALVPLTRTLSSARRSLGGASSARRQASAAQQISRAYSAAAQVAARDSVSPFDEQSRDALTAGLRAAATGFGALATAAGRSSKQAYADATLRATRGEAGVGSALDRLRAGGYKDLVTPTPGRTDIPKLEQRHRAKPQPTQSAQRSSASQSPSPTPNPTPGTGTSGTGQGSGDDSTGSGSFGGTIGGNK